ncbi:MAG: hypothetical protein MJZ13_09700, partial [Bacteroidales bacterium]|nr:hypothetical protein [Bacteroidales bacterium]
LPKLFNRVVRLADLANPLFDEIRFVNVAYRSSDGGESQRFAQFLACAYLCQLLLDLGQVIVARSGQWSVILLSIPVDALQFLLGGCVAEVDVDLLDSNVWSTDRFA